MIYEGSDEMQANDLLLRKVLADQGVAFAELLALFDEECASAGAYAGLLVGLCSKLHRALMSIRIGVESDGEYLYRVTGNFLHLLAEHCWHMPGHGLHAWRRPGSRRVPGIRKSSTARRFFRTCCPRLTCVSPGRRRRRAVGFSAGLTVNFAQ